MYFDMTGNYTLEEKGKRGSVKVTTGGKEKLRFTVQLTAMADGRKLPPLIIFKGDGFHWLPLHLRPDPPGSEKKKGKRKRSSAPTKGTIWYEICRRLPDARGVMYPPRSKVHIITSPSATSCERCTKYFLNTIWKYRRGGQQTPALLVWDSFTAHGTKAVKELVQSMNTQTHVIDGGLTPVLQPMDRVINRVSNVDVPVSCLFVALDDILCSQYGRYLSYM